MTRDERRWLKSKVDRLLRSLLADGWPIWWLKVHGGPMQRAGVPDYLLCLNGRFLALEIKHPDDAAPRPAPRQLVELQAITRARGTWLVANSIEAVDTWLQANREN